MIDATSRVDLFVCIWAGMFVVSYDFVMIVFFPPFLDILIETPLFQNFSYMLFPKTYVRTSTQITINFKPLALNGILFYVSRDDQSTTGDFLSIILHNG